MSPFLVVAGDEVERVFAGPAISSQVVELQAQGVSITVTSIDEPDLQQGIPSWVRGKRQEATNRFIPPLGPGPSRKLLGREDLVGVKRLSPPPDDALAFFGQAAREDGHRRDRGPHRVADPREVQFPLWVGHGVDLHVPQALHLGHHPVLEGHREGLPMSTGVKNIFTLKALVHGPLRVVRQPS